MREKNKSLKGPGRPAGSSKEGRERLLQAAEELFMRHHYSTVSIRDIAKAANLNPAMIYHYFGNKQGLYKEVVQRKFTPLMAMLEELKDSNNENSKDPVAFHLKNVTALLSESPWLIQMMLREMISADSPLKQFFLENVSGKLIKLLPSLIQASIDTGHYRSDLNPRMMMLTLVSLGVFPHIFIPHILAGSDPELVKSMPDIYDRFLQHNLKLFEQGCLAKGENNENE